jgi:dienelactone hydrolase
MAAPYLPEPTGPHPVGTTSVYLNDVSRPDQWVAEMPSRELMISVWYPTTSTTGERAGYLTRAEAELMISYRNAPIDPELLSSVRTNALRDAPPNPKLSGLPLVLLSPGFTQPRATLTSIAEELASHGYVAVAIDHTYENTAMTFPDGRLVRLAVDKQSGLRDHPRDPSFWAKVRFGRAHDASFVLDQLLADPRWSVDPNRVGMAGHSAGGAATIAAMLDDERIRAGGNVDGSSDPLIPATGLARPFLLLGRDGQYSPGDGPAADTWSRDWALLTGWKRWLVVTGAAHASFTDLGLLADQLGVPQDARIPGLRAMAITRACLRAFFDIHLRDQPPSRFDNLDLGYSELIVRLGHTPSRT